MKDAKLPYWDEKKCKVQMKAVCELAGLLCYTDVIEQTRGKEIGMLLSEKTKKVLID